MTNRFPADFVWGVATAAYQIEGAVDEDGRSASIWDTFSHTPGKVLHGDTGDVAVDHYHRYPEDVQLMADLGVRAYRFSIAWPRILPGGTGKPNAAGIDFYRRLIDELDSRGIAAYATLYHWDLPQALEDEGGWRNRNTAHAFAEYAAVVAEALAGRVTAWATFNEPWCSAFQGHGSGSHAPGLTDMSAAFAAAHHLNLAHGLAVRSMRSVGAANIGTVLNLVPVRVTSESPENEQAAEAVYAARNSLWLDPLFDGHYGDDVHRIAAPHGGLPVVDGDGEITSAPIDWLGINYYNDALVPDDEDRPRTDMGWPITPEGMFDVLDMARRRADVPLFITENGAAFTDPADGSLDDSARVAYLDAHLRQVLRAVEAGVPVAGYFVWSLLDNFEWAEGFSKRFGLVGVDYETLERQPRASYRWYRDLIASGGFR